MNAKRWIAALAALFLLVPAAACAAKVPAGDTSGAGETSPASAPETAQAQIPNPWRDLSEEEALALCGGSLRVPEGAQNARWSAMESGAEPVLVQLVFDLDGLSFTARAQASQDPAADISGMYYSWDSRRETTLRTWGEAGLPAVCSRHAGGDGTAEVCAWYDAASGTAYALSVTAEDLDGFDLAAVAEALSPAGPAPAPAALPLEEQRRILEENRSLWAFEEAGYQPDWSYTFTDLDGNGLLEVLSASTQGSGVYTYVRFYEVLPDGSGLRDLRSAETESDGPADWPEIIRESLPCYYDREADRRYYVCDDTLRDGASHGVTTVMALCLKDGAASWETLASMDVLRTESGETVRCYGPDGGEISGEEFRAAAQRRFAGLEQTELKLEWRSGTADTAAFKDAYADVLLAYRTALETGSTGADYAFEHGLSEFLSGSSRPGWALLDLDGDGTPELIVGDPENAEPMILFAVYTLKDGAPVPLAVSSARDRYYLLTDNRVLNEGSGGAWNTMVFVLRKSGDGLEGVEGLVTAPSADNTRVLFYQQEGSVSYDPRPDDRTIREEEFTGAWDRYREDIRLPDLTPFV